MKRSSARARDGNRDDLNARLHGFLPFRLTSNAASLYCFPEGMKYITSQANGAQEEFGSSGRLPAYIVRHEHRTRQGLEKRQRAAIERFAKAAGYELVDWFYDPAVKGEDPIESRPGFSALLDRVENNGVKVAIVEDASRLARKLVAQELGVLTLSKRAIKLITSSGDDLTDTDDEGRVMMRQIAGAFAEYEKRRLVRKLREARERTGKLGGRKRYAQAMPETVALAKELHDRGLSYRKIAAELAAQGHVTRTGKPHVASAVQRMLGN